MRYAGFWARVVATLIDMVVFMVVGGIGAVAVYMAGGISETGEPQAGYMVGLDIAWFILGVLYYVLMEAGPTQGTLGKMAMGLKVTDTDGNRISNLRSLGRYFARFLSAIILLIGYIMCAFHPRKQTLHDVLCGTLVVAKLSE